MNDVGDFETKQKNQTDTTDDINISHIELINNSIREPRFQSKNSTREKDKPLEVQLDSFNK